MTKKQALALWGGNISQMCRDTAISRPTVYEWPEDEPLALTWANRIIGAAVRLGKMTDEEAKAA